MSFRSAIPNYLGFCGSSAPFFNLEVAFRLSLADSCPQELSFSELERGREGNGLCRAGEDFNRISHGVCSGLRGNGPHWHIGSGSMRKCGRVGVDMGLWRMCVTRGRL